MAQSITSINALLVRIKTTNSTLLPALQKLGFDTQLSLGAEQEYTVKTLINSINALTIQLLTITSNRQQFIHRTNFKERLDIESNLKELHDCLEKSKQMLSEIDSATNTCDASLTLMYTLNGGQAQRLALFEAVHFIESIKPYCRILESITTQERIHALSAVLESILSKTASAETITGNNNTLTEEKAHAVALSQRLMSHG